MRKMLKESRLVNVFPSFEADQRIPYLRLFESMVLLGVEGVLILGVNCWLWGRESLGLNPGRELFRSRYCGLSEYPLVWVVGPLSFELLNKRPLFFKR